MTEQDQLILEFSKKVMLMLLKDEIEGLVVSEREQAKAILASYDALKTSFVRQEAMLEEASKLSAQVPDLEKLIDDLRTEIAEGLAVAKTLIGGIIPDEPATPATEPAQEPSAPAEEPVATPAEEPVATAEEPAAKPIETETVWPA